MAPPAGECTFSTRARDDTGFGSGTTAERLYVERKVARLSEETAARLLGVPVATYRELELGRRDFALPDALHQALAAFEREYRQCHGSRK